VSSGAPTSGETGIREGSLQAPSRHPLEWRNAEFTDEKALEKELERVFDICHGCRRCFSLCNSFPTLFDAIDASETLELDGVDKKVYWDVVDHCYLCDMCFMTKCPYVPPHPWNIDFPHLMLRAKHVQHRKGEHSFRDKLLSNTRGFGSIAGIPVVAEVVNAVNATKAGRALLEATLGVDKTAPIPKFHSRTGSARARKLAARDAAAAPKPAGPTTGKVALFVTCYGDRNEPHLPEDLVAVFGHNGIPVTVVGKEKCCGMPKLELGDLDTVEKYKNFNVPELKKLVDEGFDIVAPIPSCVLMFKQELPLMFPDDADVQAVKARIFDPFEYLMHRHKAGLLRTDFTHKLGKVSYHVPCHLRVQNIGLKTRDVLRLVPETTVEVIERCSGHNGTYAVKKEYRSASVKIGRPVMSKVQSAQPDHYSSDCPMAGHQIQSGLTPAEGESAPRDPEHPLTLIRKAYGL
jgi:glycerol-3-phosphate dehydrogenase subunit C